ADLSVSKFPVAAVQNADVVAFHLPMHTATRMAAPLIRRIHTQNPKAKICCYGLYAPMNDKYLRGLGVNSILGGEFEADLVRLAAGEAASTGLAKLDF